MYNRRFETQPQTPTTRCTIRPSVEAERARSHGTQRRTDRGLTCNRFIACLLLLFLSSAGRQAMAQGEWADGFGLAGLDGEARALTTFDDGTGEALYAGGLFEAAGGVRATNIARWDGSNWAPLLTGLDGVVAAMTVFDDGSGAALYAGGAFTAAGGVGVNGIAKWDGSIWSPLNSGVNGSVTALVVFNDGTGPALYAGGTFTAAGGVSADNIAKWNGVEWSPLGSGVDDRVDTLCIFDDGNGLALYAGGFFTKAGDIDAGGIAKWNGSAWSPVGVGTTRSVEALAVFDDGTGPALYAGGFGFFIGNAALRNIAKWDGRNWSPLGSGTTGIVSVLTVFDDGTGPALFVGGGSFSLRPFTRESIVKWDGSDWFTVGDPFDIRTRVRALAVFDDGTGSGMYLGGEFSMAADVSASNIAKWNGSAWSALPDEELSRGMSGGVSAFAVFDDGSGSALYAGGGFTLAGNVLASGIAKRGGRDWFPVGGGVDGRIFALIVFDDGTGAALYAGGNFTAAGEVDANSIAKWDGASWSALGGGLLQARRLVGTVFDLAVFDDGSGPAIFAGGDFNTAGTVTANSIAKWDGSSWSALDGGVAETFNKVFALAVFDDRTGSALYAGGFFREIGGIDARFIAKWDGSAWSTVGGGVGNRVGSLTVFNDETGPGLFAGGSFLTAGGVSANGIAKWNGRNWSALGSGVTVGSGVSALSGFEDETGPVLYAGGSFKTAGGTEANRIAKWDGSTWSALGSGMGAGFGFSTGVAALTSFDDGSRRVLYAGGRFRTAGGKPSSDIAAWRVPFDCNNNGIRDDCDSTCASPGRPCFDVAGCGESVDRNENGSPDECELLGDCDFDGLVSLRDGGMFADCVTGPGVAVDALDACRCDDLNGDGFVDLRDAAEFGSFFGSSR